MQIENYMKANRRVLFVGPPGCAKTARVAAAAKACGRKLEVVRASLCERIDFGGALVPDIQAGVTRALPLELLSRLRTTKEPTVLFLDDLGQAPLDVQAALMRLFDTDELSEHVLIWGATNRPGDKASVVALCEPLRSRFELAFAIATPNSHDAPDGAVILGTWDDEVKGWLDWALDHDAAPEIIAWHRQWQTLKISDVGPVLYGWKPHADPAVRLPDYRTWESTIKLWNFGFRDLSTIAASIGKPQAAAFLAFASLADKLPTPEQVRMDPLGAIVPTEPSSLFLIASMLAGALEPSWAGPFVQYVDRLPRIYGALAVKDAFRKLGAKLTGNKHWQSWFLRNQSLFEVSK